MNNILKTESFFITGLLFLSEITEFSVSNGYILYTETRLTWYETDWNMSQYEKFWKSLILTNTQVYTKATFTGFVGNPVTIGTAFFF